MAYKPKNLSALAYSSVFSLWHYKAELDDNLDAEGFFDRCGQLKRADVIVVSLETSTGPRTRFYTVTKAEPGFVIVKPQGKEHLAHTREIVKTKGKDDEKTTTIENPETTADTGQDPAPENGRTGSPD